MTEITLGQKIKVVRLLRGRGDFRQSDLASVLSVAQSRVSYFESGKVSPSSKELEAIETFFGLSFDDQDVEMAFLTLANDAAARETVQAALDCLERHAAR